MLARYAPYRNEQEPAENLDVGIAASIELYLGNDVLQIDGKARMPVQWTGYDKVLQQYQGEVVDKSVIHARFRQKLCEHQSDPGPEWDDLRMVLKTIFSAFASRNKEAIFTRTPEP